MVKGNTPEEMIAYFGKIVNGTSGIDGSEISRESSSVFNELLRFPEVRGINLSLPLVEDHAGAVFRRAPVEHQTFVEPVRNLGRVSTLSRATSPFSSDQTSHPLAGIDYGSVGDSEPESFIFDVKPADSDLRYSIVIPRDRLRRAGTYAISAVMQQQ